MCIRDSSGTPRVSDISYDSDGTAIMNETSSGKNGYDLHLTIDVELQKKVDAILEDTLKKYAGTTGPVSYTHLDVYKRQI